MQNNEHWELILGDLHSSGVSYTTRTVTTTASTRLLLLVIIMLTLSQTSPGFYVSSLQVFRKHCGKRRNCSLRAISPFPTVFSTCLKNFLAFSSNLKLSSANSFSLEESKFVVWERVNI